MKKIVYYFGLFAFIFHLSNASQKLYAQSDGSLDNTFGTGGKVITPIGSNDAGAYSVAIQSDGRIVAAGWNYNGIYDNFVVVRYNTDGTLDNNFGTGGKVITDLSNPTEAYSLVIQSDGKIVIAGAEEIGANYDFVVLRYNTNGTPDPGFGANGVVTTDINGHEDKIFSVALQGKKIVAAGISFNGSNYDFALARYDTNGTLDNTFGTGGKVITSISSSDDKANSLVVQPNGNIVVAGSSWNGTNYDFTVVRYNMNGTLDNSFGTNGIKTVDIASSDDYAYSVKLQGDGKIVAVGTTAAGNGDFVVIRFNADGTLDSNFGTGGKLTTDFNGTDDEAYTLVIQGDGKIVVAGLTHITGVNLDFAVARYNSGGTLDNTFGTGGKVTTPVGTANDWATSMALQSDGKIVVAGYVDDGAGTDDIAIVRYFVTPLGINDNSQCDNLILYPNPANHILTVKTVSNTKDDLVNIFNMQGQLIHQQLLLNTQTEINVSDLAKGMYVVKVSNMGTTIVKHFVKE